MVRRRTIAQLAEIKKRVNEERAAKNLRQMHTENNGDHFFNAYNTNNKSEEGQDLINRVEKVYNKIKMERRAVAEHAAAAAEHAAVAEHAAAAEHNRNRPRANVDAAVQELNRRSYFQRLRNKYTRWLPMSQSIEKQLTEVWERFSKRDAYIENLKNQIKNNENKIKQLQNQHSNNKETITKLQKKIKELQDQLNQTLMKKSIDVLFEWAKLILDYLKKPHTRLAMWYIVCKIVGYFWVASQTARLPAGQSLMTTNQSWQFAFSNPNLDIYQRVGVGFMAIDWIKVAGISSRSFIKPPQGSLMPPGSPFTMGLIDKIVTLLIMKDFLYSVKQKYGSQVVRFIPSSLRKLFLRQNSGANAPA